MQASYQGRDACLLGQGFAASSGDYAYSTPLTSILDQMRMASKDPEVYVEDKGGVRRKKNMVLENVDALTRIVTADPALSCQDLIAFQLISANR